MRTLTPRQQKFVDEYLIDQNATQAYKRAGYKCRSDHAAHSCSHKLLLNPAIAAKIAAGLGELAKGVQLSRDDAWRESRCIATSDIGDVIDMTGEEFRLKPAHLIPAHARRAIKSCKVKRYVEGTGDEARVVELIEFKFWDKCNQLNTTLRALGELKDTHEHGGPDGGVVPITIEFTGSAARPDA